MMALGSDGRDYVGMVLNNAMFTCDCRDVVLDIFAWVCFLVKAFATMLRIDLELQDRERNTCAA